MNKEHTERGAAAARERPVLVLSYRHRRVTAAGETVPLRPADFAFYAVMARRAATGGSFISYRTPGLARDYLKEYRLITDEYADAGKRDRVARRVNALENALRHRNEHIGYRNWFSERKARVNRAIRTRVHDKHGRIYEVCRRNSRPKTVFGLDIEPSRIRILDSREK